MNKLKEIRDKCFPPTPKRVASGADLYFTVTEVDKIQAESYELGKQEVIEGLIEWAREYLPISNFSFNSVTQDAKKLGGDEVRKLVRNKLNELKEEK